MTLARLPPDTTQFWIALRYQIRYYLRSSRFYLFFGILAAIGVIVYIVIAYRGALAHDPSDFFSSWFGIISAFFAAMVGVVFGGDAASTDLGTAAGFYVLPLPIRRTTLLLGRFVAAFLLAFASIAIYMVIVTLAAFHSFGTIPGLDVAFSFGLAALLVAAALAVSTFFSALSRHQAYGFILSFIVLFIAFSTAASLLQLYANIPTWWSISSASGVVLLPFSGATGGGGGPMTGALPENYLQGAGVLAIYLVGFGATALAIFRRKELQL